MKVDSSTTRMPVRDPGTVTPSRPARSPPASGCASTCLPSPLPYPCLHRCLRLPFLERRVDRLVGLRIQEVVQPGLVRLIRVADLDRDLLFLHVVRGFDEAHLSNHPDHLLRRAQRLRALRHQLLGQPGHLGLQAGLRHREVHDADPCRLLPVECIAGARVVDRVPQQHRVGEGLADHAARQDAPVHLRQRERRVVGRDREVRGEQMTERAADAIALDHRDRRLVEHVETIPLPVIGQQPDPLGFGGVVLQRAEEFLQILTGGEDPADARDDDDLRLRVGLELVQRRRHLHVQRRTHRVLLLGPVQVGPGNSVLPDHLHVLAFRQLHCVSSFLSRFPIRRFVNLK